MLQALRDLRNVSVVVYHPQDGERDELVDQLRRIGCRVNTCWPPREAIPGDADIIFALFRQDSLTQVLLKALAGRSSGVTLIGIVEFESPAVVESIVRAGATSIITKPVRAFGLLTNMVIAHTFSAKEKNLIDRVGKLEARLTCFRKLEKAKQILMQRKNMSEPVAYETIRVRAMASRVTVEVVCDTIINADKFVGL